VPIRWKEPEKKPTTPKVDIKSSATAPRYVAPTVAPPSVPAVVKAPSAPKWVQSAPAPAPAPSRKGSDQRQSAPLTPRARTNNQRQPMPVSIAPPSPPKEGFKWEDLKALEVGNLQTHLADAQRQVMFDPNNPEKAKAVEILQQQLNDAQIDTSNKTFLARGVIGALKQLPLRGRSLVHGAKYGAPGAAVGAGAAAIAGQLGPQIALPEEIATVPLGAWFGAKTGMKLGSTIYMAQQEMGPAYFQYRSQGMTHEEAFAPALAAGVINGVVETLQLDRFIKTIPGLGTAIDEVKKRAVLEIMKNYAQYVALETSEEVIQSLVTNTMGQIAAAVANSKRLPEDQIAGMSIGEILSAAGREGAEAFPAVLVGGLPGHVAQAGIATFTSPSTPSSITQQIPEVNIASVTPQTVDVHQKGPEYRLQTLNEALRTTLDSVGTPYQAEIPLAVATSQATIKSRPDLQIAQTLSKKIGVEVVFYNPQDVADLHNGMYYDGAIYINERAQNPAHVVFGHELVHTFTPTEKAEFSYLMKELRKDPGAQQYFNKLKLEHQVSTGEILDRAQLNEEFLGDFLGENFTNESFIDKIAQASPSLAKRIWTGIKKLLSRLSDDAKNTPHEQVQVRQFVKDLEKAENKFAQIIGARIEAQKDIAQTSPMKGDSFLKASAKIGIHEGVKNADKFNIPETHKLVTPEHDRGLIPSKHSGIFDKDGSKTLENNLAPTLTFSQLQGSEAKRSIPRVSTRREENVFYSQLVRTINEKMPGTADKATVLEILNSPEIKRDEVKWTRGLEKWVSRQKGEIKKEELFSYIQEHGPQFVQKIVKPLAHKKKETAFSSSKDYSEQVYHIVERGSIENLKSLKDTTRAVREEGFKRFSTKRIDNFYSQLVKDIEKKIPYKTTKKALLSIIEGPAIKPEEVKWAGKLKEWVEAQDEPILKEDIIAHIHEYSPEFVTSSLKAEESIYRPILPFAASRAYQENFYHINQRPAKARTSKEIQELKDNIEAARKALYDYWDITSGSMGSAVADAIPREVRVRHEPALGRELAKRRAEYTRATQNLPFAGYKTGHFDDKAPIDLIAHSRTDMLTTRRKERVLHVHEIQSDWHQTGRREGYGTLNQYSSNPPEGPHSKTWPEFVAKNILNQAIETNAEYITWSTPEQQVELYGTDVYAWMGYHDAKGNPAWDIRYRETKQSQYMTYLDTIRNFEELDQIAPDHIAKKIWANIQQSPGFGTFKPRERGMEIFYGTYVPKAFESALREIGQKFVPIELEVVDADGQRHLQPGFKFTTEIAKAIKDKGFKKFSTKRDNFYSQLVRTIERKMPKTADKQMALQILRSPEVKPEEVKWVRGIEAWIHKQEGKVKKDDLLTYIYEHSPRFTSINLPGTYYAAYTPFRPSDKYLENLYHIEKLAPTIEDPQILIDLIDEAKLARNRLDEYQETLIKKYPIVPGDPVLPLTREEHEKLSELYDAWILSDNAVLSLQADKPFIGYIAPHFSRAADNIPDIIAHSRTDILDNPEKERVLHIFEIQSDWHQAGRKYGYNKQDPRGNITPEGPHSKTWLELAVKNLLNQAVHSDAKYITWATSKQQVEVNGTDVFEWVQLRDDEGLEKWEVKYTKTTLNNKRVLLGYIETLEDLREKLQGSYYTANKVWNAMQQDPFGMIKPREEGMEIFYGTYVPKAFESALREIGQKFVPITVTVVDDSNQGRKQPGIEITPEIVKAIQDKGFKKFSTKRGFYSQLYKTVEKKMPKTADKQVVLNILQSPEIKPDEVLWTRGLKFWINSHEGKINKTDLLAYIHEASPSFIKTSLTRNNTAYRGMLPFSASEDYSEDLYHIEAQQPLEKDPIVIEELKTKLQAADRALDDYRLYQNNRTLPDDYQARTKLLAKELLEAERLMRNWQKAKKHLDKVTIRQPVVGHYIRHFRGVGIPDVFVHVRTDVLDTADAYDAVLHVHEIQSDWHQDGRKFGYDTSPHNIPEGPHSKTWLEFAVKNLLHDAALSNYHYLTWSTGDQQIKMYGTDIFKWRRQFGNIWKVDLYESTNPFQILENATIGTMHGLHEIISLSDTKKAEKVWKAIQASPEQGKIEPRAAGMKAFYETLVPKAFEAALREIGQKFVPITVEVIDVNDFTHKQPGIEITPEIIQAIHEKGFKKFSIKRSPKAQTLEQKIAELKAQIPTMSKTAANKLKKELARYEALLQEVKDREVKTKHINEIRKILTQKLIIPQIKQQAKEDRKLATGKLRHRLEAIRLKKREKRAKLLDRRVKKDLLESLRQLKAAELRPHYRAAADQLLEGLDLKSIRMNLNNKLKLEKAAAFFQAQQAHDPSYEIPEGLQNRLRRLNQKRIGDMSADDIQVLQDAVTHILKLNELTNKLIADRGLKEFESVKQAALRGINAPNNKQIKRMHWLQKQWDYLMKTGALMPEMLAARLLGWDRNNEAYKVLYTDMEEGQRKMYGKQQEIENYLDEQWKGIDTIKWDANKHDVKLASGTYKLTSGEKISLYLHSLHPQNRAHIIEGGFTTEENLAVTKLTAEDLAKIGTELKPQELDVAKSIHHMFNEMLSKAINETSVKLKGYEIARVRDYFPIITEKMLQDKDFPSHLRKAVLEQAGYLKTRQGGTNAIRLESVFRVVERSKNMVSAYYGQAIPLRNLKMLLGNADVSNAILKKYGENVLEIYQRLWQQLEGNRERLNPSDRAIKTTMHNVIQSILGLGPWIWFKQLASIPSAWADIDAKYLAQGVATKADWKTMEAKSPIMWLRRRGYINPEAGEIARRRQEHRKPGSWTTMPIQTFDNMAIASVWNAVIAETKDLEPQLSGDAFWDRVARRTEKIIFHTQPNFSALQRSDVARTESVLLRLATLFASQRNTNYNLLYEAGVEASQGNYKKATRIVSAVAAGSLTVAAIDLVRFKWRDREDQEELAYLTEQFAVALMSNAYFAESLYSILIKGRAREDAVDTAIQDFLIATRDLASSPFTPGTLSPQEIHTLSITDLREAATSRGISTDGRSRNALIQALTKYNPEGATSLGKMVNVIRAVAHLGGIPVANVLRELEAALNQIDPLLAYEWQKLMENPTTTKQMERLFKEVAKYPNPQEAFAKSSLLPVLKRDMIERGITARSVESSGNARNRRKPGSIPLLPVISRHFPSR